MPGKKKKERKPPPGARKGKNKAASGPKGRPQYGAQQETRRPTGQKHQGGHASKAFTLVDEALGSTRLGSKRLWKGAAATSKLRHLPIVFIRAAEAYDPSKVLRDQIAATVLAEPKVNAEDVTTDATEVSVLDDVLPKDEHSELEQELLSTLHGDVPAETSTPIERVERQARQAQPTETTPTDAVAAVKSPAAIEEHVKTPRLSDAPEAQADSDRPRLSSSAPVDLDALLESIGVVDTELEQQVQSQVASEAMAASTAESEEDEDDSDESDMDEDSNLSGSSEEILEEEEISFYVDTEGDTTFASLDIQSTSARPLTLTAASTPARVAASGDSTPWARTIDDPVATEHAMPTTSEKASLVNVFEQSGGRGKRGGRRKRERQEMVQEQLRMDEAYAIHLDYMEHSRWRDAGDSDDAQEIEDEDDDGDKPLLARMLAGLGPANTFGNTEPMHDSELDDEDAEEEDDSMDDDALEAFLDAESQLVDFGRSGRKASRRAYNDYSADALFHDDFNVYDYNSAGEDDLESLPDLPASGARRRDLNQFVQDLDLSDEELELELIAQWKADKASKKSRKRERQQQHAEGLLGKRAKRARAAHAQNGGETLGEYHSIIKRFVSHADYVGVAQLPLPAMDRSVRRAVHIIAQHGYQLQTTSQGSGKRRYPVLYKTQHTCTAERLPDALFMEEVMAQAQKTVGYTSSIKHRSALQPGGKVKGKGKGATGGGGGIGKAAGGGAGKLRDGEIVGEHAPEIALSNRGRAMLEKLGWSRGTGLGVAGNVGISVPIMATVKNSRVGLGT